MSPDSFVCLSCKRSFPLAGTADPMFCAECREALAEAAEDAAKIGDWQAKAEPDGSRRLIVDALYRCPVCDHPMYGGHLVVVQPDGRYRHRGCS